MTPISKPAGLQGMLQSIQFAAPPLTLHSNSAFDSDSPHPTPAQLPFRSQLALDASGPTLRPGPFVAPCFLNCQLEK